MRELPFKVGDEIKNYKEMCKLLDEKVRNGNSKKSQLKRWEKLFSWNNEGYRFIITEVHKSTYLHHDNNKVGINVKAYSEYLQSLLLHFLKIHSIQNKDTYVLEISARGLMGLMDLFSTEFFYLLSDEKKREHTIERFGIKDNFLLDFQTRVNTTTRSDIHTALKQLEQKSIIAVEEIYLGRFLTDFKNGIPASAVKPLQSTLESLDLTELFSDYVNTFGVVADDINPIVRGENKYRAYSTRSLYPFEVATYLALQTKLLKQSGLSSVHEVYVKNRTQHFYDKLNTQTENAIGINYVFKGYRIIFLPKTIDNHELFNSFQLDKNFLKEIKSKFTHDFQNGIVQNYNNRLDKSLSKNLHLPIIDSEFNTLVCNINHQEMTHSDRVLLSVENLEDSVITLLEYFMQK